MVRNFSKRQRRQIIAGYNNGKTIEQLRQELKAGESSINRVLDEEGVKRRAPGENKHRKAQTGKADRERARNVKSCTCSNAEYMLGHYRPNCPQHGRGG